MSRMPWRWQNSNQPELLRVGYDGQNMLNLGIKMVFSAKVEKEQGLTPMGVFEWWLVDIWASQVE